MPKSPKTTTKVAKEKEVKKKVAKITTTVFDISGKSLGRVTLPQEIFGVAENPSLLAQAIRVFQANKRQGTQSTKTRAEVSGSTRKIYPSLLVAA